MSDETSNITESKTAVETESQIPEESFASMLEKSDGFPERLGPGQKVRARVVSISGDLVYIDLGGKSEGIISLSEFLNKDGVPSVNRGDEIEAYFVAVQDGARRLTTKTRGYSAASLGEIQNAFESGIPLAGEVKRELKGGFEVMIGEVRCFCPFSQIDLKGGREGGLYLGRTFSFKVLEYENNGRNVVLSRRALLADEKKAKVEALKEKLKPGMDVTGTINSVQNFGAFMDIGGIDGLVPASELSWNRAERPASVVSPGQEVTARILSLDWENSRITLSLKATQPDPWTGLRERYPEGSKVSGVIVRLAAFGAFVNLEPGIDGLVHISNLGTGRRIQHPKEVVEVGQTVETYVSNVDPSSKKISLSMQPKAERKKIVLPNVGEVIDGVVDKAMPYGLFVRIGDDLKGLVPNVEMGTPAGSDHKRMFPSGSAMKVVVTEVDTAAKKVRLSRKAAMEKEVREEFDEYRESLKSETTSSGFGSLGDLLRAKLEEKQTGN